MIPIGIGLAALVGRLPAVRPRKRPGWPSSCDGRARREPAPDSGRRRSRLRGAAARCLRRAGRLLPPVRARAHRPGVEPTFVDFRAGCAAGAAARHPARARPGRGARVPARDRPAGLARLAARAHGRLPDRAAAARHRGRSPRPAGAHAMARAGRRWATSIASCPSTRSSPRPPRTCCPSGARCRSRSPTACSWMRTTRAHPPRLLFVGRSTEHREKLLAPVKRSHPIVHVGHGLNGEPLMRFLRQGGRAAEPAQQPLSLV